MRDSLVNPIRFLCVGHTQGSMAQHSSLKVPLCSPELSKFQLQSQYGQHIRYVH